MAKNENEILVITGPNGSGKTRLLKAMQEIAGEDAEYFEGAVPEKSSAKVLLLDNPFLRAREKEAVRIAELAERRRVVVTANDEEIVGLFPSGSRLNLIRLSGEASGFAGRVEDRELELKEEEMKARLANMEVMEDDVKARIAELEAKEEQIKEAKMAMMTDLEHLKENNWATSSDLKLIMGLVEELQKDEGVAEIAKIVQRAKAENMDEQTAERLIDGLQRRGELFKPKPGFVGIVIGGARDPGMGLMVLGFVDELQKKYGLADLEKICEMAAKRNIARREAIGYVKELWESGRILSPKDGYFGRIRKE